MCHRCLLSDAICAYKPVVGHQINIAHNTCKGRSHAYDAYSRPLPLHASIPSSKCGTFSSASSLFCHLALQHLIPYKTIRN